jgi:hypothetical protein
MIKRLSSILNPKITPDEAEETGNTGVPTLPVPVPPTRQITSSSLIPYQSSREHLLDHMQRLHTLVQAQIVRWQATGGNDKKRESLREAELKLMLDEDFMPAGYLPRAVAGKVKDYWGLAVEQAQRIEQRRQLTGTSLTLTLHHVQTVFDLDDVQRDILLLCLLPQVDSWYAHLFAILQTDSRQTTPTIGLIQQILQPHLEQPEAILTHLSPSSPLLAYDLLCLPETGSHLPLPLRSVHLDDRITGYLWGQSMVDGRLTAVLQDVSARVHLDDLIMPDERRTTLTELTAVLPQQLPLTMLWYGAYGSGRLSAAQAICWQMGLPLLAVDVAAALPSGTSWPALVRLCLREALLRGTAVYWMGCEQLIASQEQSPHWQQLVTAVEKFPGLTILDSQSNWTPTGQFRQHTFLSLDFPLPNYEIRQQLWQGHLPSTVVTADPDLIELLAASFQLTEGQIEDAIATASSLARRRQPSQPDLTQEDLYEGCRRQSSQKLVALAQRVQPRPNSNLDDDPFTSLVLPRPVRQQLQELYGRIRHYYQLYERLGFTERLSLGKGTIALFTGTTGTGKTMAAELLASAQKTDLYKIDLAAVVSKYVGETEKNLNKVFDQAEDSNAILFFDEADALFGKRGEVKDARDRWANLEVNYLLQRIEEYAGVVIMATNLRQNIDTAFLRRIHIIIDFPFPDPEARLRILHGMFPPDINHPDAESLQQLTDKFELAGGSWRNIVIDAAFRALAETDKETQPTISLLYLVLATAREYQKLGKPITKGEFGHSFYDWIEKEIF